MLIVNWAYYRRESLLGSKITSGFLDETILAGMLNWNLQDSHGHACVPNEKFAESWGIMKAGGLG